MTTATIVASLDTYLNGAFYTSNYGSLPGVSIANVWAGGSKLDNNRPVGYFDLSSIPAGATIDSAVLRQNIYNVDIGNAPAGLYRLTRDDVDELQATWNNYKAGTPWTVGGAAHNDDDHTLTDKVTFTFPAGTGVFDIEGMETLVEDAIAERDNQLRVLLYFDHELVGDPHDRYNWRSREYGTAAERWRLVVEYTEAPTPTPAQPTGHRSLRRSSFGERTGSARPAAPRHAFAGARTAQPSRPQRRRLR